MMTLVTAFFLQPTAKHSVDTYRAHFAKLVALGRPIVLFLDRTLEWTFPPHVRVIPCSFQETWPATMIPDTAMLPPYRSSADTLDYMRIMLAKTEFLVRATGLVPECDWFIWVDFGLPHVFRRPEETLNRLRDLPLPSAPCIQTAGIWNCVPHSLTESVCWRFAGGFFLAHRSKAQEFDTAVRQSVQRFLPHAVWEVNAWADAERHGLDLGWFAADHDDSIIPFTEQR
jgi:hypothetical protein